MKYQGDGMKSGGFVSHDFFAIFTPQNLRNVKKNVTGK